MSGVLYVVATPIGNLGDITIRAVETLKEVDIVLAEDTRHSKKLFVHYEINSYLRAFHEHNENEKVILNHKKVKEYLDKNDLESAVLTLFSI